VPLTSVRAKAAVPVNGEPLVRRIIRSLAAQGISDIVLNLHHRPATITAAVGDGSDLGARVRYSWEQPVLGSAGGPRHALPLLASPGARSTILLVNGDTLTDAPIGALLTEHGASGAAVTMALVPNPRPDKYGGVTVSGDGWVTGFTRRGVSAESFHFIGVQAADSGLYPKLMAADPRSVRAFISESSFQDIGTPLDYLDTSLHLAGREGDRLARGARTRVARSAVLTRTAVWDDVVIGEGARLTECIVCDGARVPEGAHYTRCAILAATPGLRQGPGRIEGALFVQPLDGS
jgi:NDP-sugar pyrophosphorylase family protein